MKLRWVIATLFPFAVSLGYSEGAPRFTQSSIISARAISPPVIVTIDDPEIGDVAYLSMTIRPNGRPIMSYVHSAPSSVRVKVAQCGTVTCGSASYGLIGSNSGEVFRNTEVLINSDGQPIIAHWDWANGLLKYANCLTGDCSSGGIGTSGLIGTQGVEFDTHLASYLIGLGRPAFILTDVQGAIISFRCGPPSCGNGTSSTVSGPPETSAKHISVVVGADQRPNLTYYDASSGDLRFAKCETPDCVRAPWVTIDSSLTVAGADTAIAIGADGMPVISYQDADQGTIKVAKCVDATCSLPAEISVLESPFQDSVSFTSVVVLSNGTPLIAHAWQGQGLSLAWCNNAACSTGATFVLVDGDADAGQWVTAKLSNEGLPLVAYRSGAGGGSIKFLRCPTLDCQDALLANGFEEAL